MSNTRPHLPFQNRQQAGQELARLLGHYRGQPGLLVLALPRGGVAVACEVARVLQAPLDIFMVRKLGFPGQEEYAMGAIASGGVCVMNPLIEGAVSPEAVQAVVSREQAELARRELFYRQQRPAEPLQDRILIVVDDGLATGATMQAALLAIRQQQPRHLAAAVPVGAADSCAALGGQADAVICCATPEPFRAVGRYYRDFPQCSDDEVCTLLEQARQDHARASHSPA